MKDLISVLDGFTHNFMNHLGSVLVGGEYNGLSNMFPGLFAEAKSEKNKGVELSPEMQVYKAQRKDHAYKLNKKRAKEG